MEARSNAVRAEIDDTAHFVLPVIIIIFKGSKQPSKHTDIM